MLLSDAWRPRRPAFRPRQPAGQHDRDGLWDAFNDYHMGITAENLADAFDISRERRDAFAASSQRKAAAAIAAGRFREEIVPVSVPQGKQPPRFVTDDEQPRPETSEQQLAQLRPAFRPADGSVTAGNASSLNDGAAAVLLMRVDKARELGLPVLARIVSSAVAGVDPSVMGIGPVSACRRAAARRLDAGRGGPYRSQRGFCRPCAGRRSAA
ncbi:hypothetical protein KPZU09_07920 [Klebsiella pneumoniae]|uniref:Thiolase N-terminal domain-containing protein n=1 Tax=Klebsiella pneumoniae TaxID=573 RepID=A0A919LLB3_KLEPN|nr:hypothetical protein KPZU09_07920 [Klebsiella pneumoniae]